ncbi:transposase [Sphingobium sp. MI1205]|nr:transposase [Sphingobium sp. MI1205]
MSAARDQLGDLLQVQSQVRGSGRFRGSAASGARGRERQAEEASGRGDARQCGAEGSDIKYARDHHGLSERRACSLVGVSRRVIRYEPTRPDDGALRQRLRELAAERRRFGYRRLGYLLAREGLRPNHKKLLRIYREEGLRVRRRGGRKRALGTRAPMALPQGPNQRWSLDFVSDSLVCGRRFRILCILDDFTRECLALVADTSLSGLRVARELTTLIGLRGKPHMVVR